MENKELEKVQRSQQERQDVVFSIRTTQTVKEFMTKHKIKPTLVFREAISKLMEKTKEAKDGLQ